MAIENRDLPVGTRLEATYKKVRYVCTVEAGDDGKLAFVLEDGKRFTSPSSAATAIIKGAANGWRFWSVEGATPAADGRRAHRRSAKPVVHAVGRRRRHPRRHSWRRATT